MIYASEMPRVVGEFDAEMLHKRIDSVAPADASLNGHTVVNAICEAEGINKYTSIEDIAGIRWHRFFRPGAFMSLSSDGEVNYLYNHQNHVPDQFSDGWHPDDNESNRLLQLPEILTTTSKWPTKFLVGKIAIKTRDIPMLTPDFWVSDTGKEAVDAAIEKGDAHEHKSEEGKVLVMPKGALHRRDIPAGFTGYRYFMRRFPTIDALHSGTVLGRIRLN